MPGRVGPSRISSVYFRRCSRTWCDKLSKTPIFSTSSQSRNRSTSGSSKPISCTSFERFLLELGQGFAFVGRQYHLQVGGSEFYIDLLFYHLKLRCFIVIDLKKGEFKPEYAGKMNFYLSVVDDKLRHASDQPSLGLILCQDRNHIVAEYALRGADKPIGISEYELTRALPPSLKSALPTVEEIE